MMKTEKHGYQGMMAGEPVGSHSDKSQATDALKRACALFGVAKELKNHARGNYRARFSTQKQTKITMR